MRELTIISTFRQAYKEGKKEKPFISSEEPEESSTISIPKDLTCTLCDDLMNDVVMIPCCAKSFCDECKYRYICIVFYLINGQSNREI